MVTHVVFMKFRADERDTLAAEAKRRLESMVGKVPSLRFLEVGLNFTESARAMDLCLTTRFDDRAGLDAYAVDPVHVEVKDWLATVLEGSAVVDYEA